MGATLQLTVTKIEALNVMQGPGGTRVDQARVISESHDAELTYVTPLDDCPEVGGLVCIPKPTAYAVSREPAPKGWPEEAVREVEVLREALLNCEDTLKQERTGRMILTGVEEGLSDVYGEIVAERKAQDEQWGGPEHDDKHNPMDWFDFIQKQYVLAGAGFEHDRKRLVKIAALAVAACESIDRVYGTTTEVDDA